MRGFWLDVNNLQHKKEVPLLAERKICVAGVEMAARDTQGGIKNLMIAASSLGNASVYFENNSASGLGGFTGGAASGIVREKALRMMQAAASLAEQLEPVAVLPAQTNPENITLFAVSGEGQIYAKQLPEEQARQRENALYGFFAYSQQLLGAFRAQQEAAQTANTPAQTLQTPASQQEEKQGASQEAAATSLPENEDKTI